jgi:hypothetical protein
VVNETVSSTSCAEHEDVARRQGQGKEEQCLDSPIQAAHGRLLMVRNMETQTDVSRMHHVHLLQATLRVCLTTQSNAHIIRPWAANQLVSANVFVPKHAQTPVAVRKGRRRSIPGRGFRRGQMSLQRVTKLAG